MTEMGLMEARATLTRLGRDLQRNPTAVVRITNRGKSSMALMSSELYETIVETLDVLSSPGAIESLRASLGDIEAGRVHTLDQVAAKLRLKR